jgi:hypothetical protein
LPKHFGRTEPRLWTRPLRVLTPDTSLGFEVIDFARDVLGIELYPWQQWLLIHALELLADGQYRFRRVVVLVGRQNGKTTIASVLAAWWLFVDSDRHPTRVPPLKFKVVGIAQNLDIAREPWAQVKIWADPKPDTEEEAALALDDLQAATAQVVDTNGKEAIIARSRAHYEIRVGKNARGKPAARVLMDELREEKTWAAWNAVSQTSKSFWNGMLIGFSNAGDSASIVLRTQRNAALEDLRDAGIDFPDAIQRGIEAAEAHANGEDADEVADEDLTDDDVSDERTALGLFEWSATPGCAKDDLDGILESNPSIGYGAMTVGTCLADIRGMTDAGYRTEVLCQWVTAKVESYIDVKDWEALHVAVNELRIPKGARTVWAVDTSHDRSMSWIAAAVYTESGRPFVNVRVKRPGMMWVPDTLEQLADQSGHREVVLQGRGCPAMEFIEPLQKRKLIVHALEGGPFALATGRMRDRVRDSVLLTVTQPDVDLAVEGGVVMAYAENLAWSRNRSLPVDISGLIAESEALYGLELLQPPPREETPPPPPKAELITRDDVAPDEVNLASARF